MGLGMGSAATVFVDVEGDLTKFRKDVAGAGGVASKELSGSMGRAGKVAGTALAAGAAGAAVKGVSSFIDFERGMNEVFTLIPEAGQGAYDELTAQTKAFASEFGVLPDTVIPSLYDSLSAGVPRDNVFEFLEEANKFAKAGATDLSTSVDALTTGVNAFGLDASDAGRVSDSLFTAVKLGKTTVDELGSSLFQVAPIAGSFGVSVEEVAAGFAVLTAQGTPTSVAATQIKGAISELGKEGTKASKAFEEISGKSFTQFIDEGGNLVDAADIMATGAEDLGLSVVDLFGSIEAGQAFVGLSADIDASNAALAAVEDGTGATQAAFEQMEKGIGPTLDKLKARFAIVAIELGTALGPTVEKVGGFVADFALALSKLPGPVLAIIVGAAALTGGLLFLAGPILKVIQLAKLFSSTLTLLAANPWTLVIIAAVAAVFLIVKYWDEIKAALVAAWDFVAGKASEVWNGITGVVETSASAVKSAVQNYVIAPAEFLIGLLTSLPGHATTAWNGILGAVEAVAGKIVSTINSIKDAAASALGPVGDVLSFGSKIGGGVGGAVGSILGFDTGGVVPGPRGAPVLALVHGGETILPTHKNPNAGLGGGGGMVVNGPLIGSATISSELDIEHVARELDRRLDRERRAQGGLGR